MLAKTIHSPDKKDLLCRYDIREHIGAPEPHDHLKIEIMIPSPKSPESHDFLKALFGLLKMNCKMSPEL